MSPARARVCTALKAELLRDDGIRHHVGDFVIMHNHVHMLITSAGDNVEPNSFRSNSPERNERRSSPPERNEFRSTTKLEAILKSIKGASAVACNRLRHRNGAFWQADSYDHIVRSLDNSPPIATTSHATPCWPASSYRPRPSTAPTGWTPGCVPGDVERSSFRFSSAAIAFPGRRTEFIPFPSSQPSESLTPNPTEKRNEFRSTNNPRRTCGVSSRFVALKNGDRPQRSSAMASSSQVESTFQDYHRAL